MEKIQKKSNKNYKKKQPLKVVYIANPVKFKTSASEFRALVQELTGQDAYTAYSSASFSTESGGEAAKVAAGDAESEEEVTKLERRRPSGGVSESKLERRWPSGGVSESDVPSTADRLYEDSFVSSLMIESFQGLDDSNLVDVLRSLDAM